MANLPTCPRCKTDVYLEYSDFQPGHDVTRTFGVWGGEIQKSSWVAPIVLFMCTNCGHRGGHSVPDDWSVPEPNPRVQGTNWPRVDTDGGLII